LRYKLELIRSQAHYLGYDFMSEAIETPAVLSASLTIPHRDMAVTVLRDQGESVEPVPGLRCYLYSMDEGEGLNATGLYADSDDQGMVHFLVPEELPYYAVTTLLGQEFISQEFEGEEIQIIELGRMIVTVRDFDLATETNPDGLVQGAVVTLCTTDGMPMGQELMTGADGQVRFTLPEGHYRLRITYDDQQFWSGDISIYPFWDTPVEITDGHGGMLSRLNNPHPPLWHGTPPQYKPMLALLSGSLSGMLNTSATPVADAPQVFYYLNDHLGTAQLLVDAAGTVIWKGETQPFGQVTEIINQIDHRFRFPGQLVDPESGLYYNWHRFYDPETGRYISADPIGLDGGMNLYAYVRGNPVNFLDFKGLQSPTGNSYQEFDPPIDCCAIPAGEAVWVAMPYFRTSDGIPLSLGAGVLPIPSGNPLPTQVRDVLPAPSISLNLDMKVTQLEQLWGLVRNLINECIDKDGATNYNWTPDKTLLKTEWRPVPNSFNVTPTGIHYNLGTDPGWVDYLPPK